MQLVYGVRGGTEAAIYIADLADRLERLVHHYADKYPDTEESKSLIRKFDKTKILETTSPHSLYTLYAVDKAGNIGAYIRQSDDTFIDKNILLYVAIHKLAHIGTTSIDNRQELWAFFKILLKEAILTGLYTKVRYHIDPIPLMQHKNQWLYYMSRVKKKTSIFERKTANALHTQSQT
jgi:hypothetical protein